MATPIPKQFIELAGRAIILRTIDRFLAVYPDIEIIVVLSKESIPLWEKLKFDHKVIIVQGGEERFHSVKNALEKASGEIIAVHDAVRPFVAESVIKNAFEIAEEKGTAIPVIPVKESMRRIVFNESEAVPRGSYRIVQTPQIFKAEIIKQAYQQKYHLYFTDDAAVAEEAGNEIYLVDGNEENIKITSPFDLQIAEQLILTQK